MVQRRTLLQAIPGTGLALTLPHLYANSPDNLLGTPHKNTFNDVKTVVTWGLSKIPEVGDILSLLTTLLWPDDSPDAWDQIKEQVEALINQKIDAAVFGIMQGKLNGLRNVLVNYIRCLPNQDNNEIRGNFLAAHNIFLAASGELQNNDYEWTLAPLFAIFSQLHVVLLRDAALHGRSWGWNDAAFQGIVTTASTTAKSYIAYLDAVSERQKEKLRQQAPTQIGPHKTAVYNYWQSFYQQHTLLIDDYCTLLIYLDPVQHPEATQDIPFKDIYSLAYGTADDWDSVCSRFSSTGVTTPFSRPLKGFTSIDIELFNTGPRVVHVHYPVNTGPLVFGKNREDLIGVISEYLPGVEKYTVTIPEPTGGRQFNVEKAQIKAGSIPWALTLVMEDGSSKWLWDRHDNAFPPVQTVAVPGRMLTTLNMWSHSRFYDGNMGCIIFGFSRDTHYIPPSLKEKIYISAVVEPNAGSDGVPLVITPQLQGKRATYWDALQRSSGS